MENIDSFQLDNGLQVFVWPDQTIKTAVINIAYDVGARDEQPEKTGFAHLFEHLMFGGSVNIPEYDTPLQRVGGENNAFTTSDYTNYYISIPSNNIETGFWLESDRMLDLSFDPRVLEVQRKVVIEEFKQRYLNMPYGDIWHKLRPMAYEKHPYRWPVIGEKIEHIEEAVMEDVRGFFNRHYTPDNAVLVVGGDVKTKEIERLTKKWFGPISKSSDYIRDIIREPLQKSARQLTVSADVPQDAIYMVFHMPERTHHDYHAVDLLSDVLGRGKSSRLYEKLVKDEQLFTSIGASVTGNADPGLFVIQAFLKEGVSPVDGHERIKAVIEEVKTDLIRTNEYEKIVNQALSSLEFSRIDMLEKCMSLSHSWILGDITRYFTEADRIKEVTKAKIMEAASRYLGEENSTTLYYLKKK